MSTQLKTGGPQNYHALYSYQLKEIGGISHSNKGFEYLKEIKTSVFTLRWEQIRNKRKDISKLWVSLKTMTTFKNVVGNRITNIQRLDSDAEYEFYSPYAIILTLDNKTEKLIITATNDGSTVDIRMTNDEQIGEDYGLEFSEHILNDLKKDDELCSFIGDRIELIRIAEYILLEITGPDFVIKKGKYAGIELKTEQHKLLFQNNYGGWCDIDDDVVKLPKQERWQWK